jgi:cellobiose-specific phosphotransferase system component IIB
MSKENNKIVIIVGAGASCDFVATQEKKLNENHGDIKFEIWKNTQDSVDENLDKKAQYFLVDELK